MEVHRDVNAARNVLKRAGAGQWGGGFARTTASLQAVVAETLGAKLAA